MFDLFPRIKGLDEMLKDFDEDISMPRQNLFNYKVINPPTNSFFRRKGSVTKVEDGYTATLALPGFKREDLNISFEKTYLTISAEIEDDKQTDFVMSFSESMFVSSDVDASKIKAKLEDGILTITMPVSKEKKSKKISIE